MVKLYRFQPTIVPGDDRVAKLEHGEIYFSDPSTFNDPMDLNIVIKDLIYRWLPHPEHKNNIKRALAVIIEHTETYAKHWLFDEETIDIFRQWSKNSLPPFDMSEGHIVSALEKSLARFGVCCLTPKFDSRLMWAHYANSGKGFCIEYEVDWTKVPYGFMQLSVQYVSQLSELCITEAMFTPDQFLDRALATKHIDWSYEQEIRIISCNGKGKMIPVSPDFMKITGLIAGLEMPHPLQCQLKLKAKLLGVSAYAMNKKFGYELRKELM